MKKQILAMLLTGAVLTGCGSGDATTTNNTTDTATAALTEAVEQNYVAPEMKGEISISTIDEQYFLNDAALLFMEKYPDVKVTVNTFRYPEFTAMENGVAVVTTGGKEGESDADYLNLLNTQLMSGKADDIIITDSLQLSKYIEMGAFEDLSGYLSQSPEISAETHNMNAFEMMKDENGALYEIPMSWGSGSIAVFDQVLVDASEQYLDDSITSVSFANALEYGRQLVDGSDLPNTYLLLDTDATNTAVRLVNSRLSEFVDVKNKTVNFSNQDFIDIINYAKSLQDAGYYDTNLVTNYNEDYHFGLSEDYDVSAAYNSLLPEMKYYRALPMSNADGSVSGKAKNCLGITSGSENKELAWEFIKFLLSDEVQTLPSFFDMGVNYNGRDAYLKTYFDAFNEDNESSITFEDMTAVIDNWMDEINCYERKDSTIANLFIYDEVGKFISGEQTAEETAAALQTKIDMYLNE